MTDLLLEKCAKKLKAVFIFGGDIIPDSKVKNGYRSLRGDEADKTGGCPSYERVLAGEAIFRMNPDVLLVPSGGTTNLKKILIKVLQLLL